jgi:hypothetical protein
MVEASGGVNAFPRAQAVHDVFYLALLVFQTFAGVHVGNVNNGFQRWVQHLGNGVHVRAGIEKVAHVQRLEPVVAVELFVVGVGDGLKPRFINRG